VLLKHETSGEDRRVSHVSLTAKDRRELERLDRRSREFRLTKEEKHYSFGHDLVGQFRELKL
jgi:DNA-binding MarR family transcriptional regulator